MKKWLVLGFLVLAVPAWAQTPTFVERMALAEDVAFKTRVEFAAIKAAVAIQAEDPTTCCYTGGVTEATATPEQKAAAAIIYGQRGALAAQTLADPPGVARNLAKAVVTNLAITSESTDSDIEFTVATMWNAFAKRTR